MEYVLIEEFDVLADYMV